jgi:hypothetical protein
MERAVGRPDDKLLAVSAIATVMYSQFEARHGRTAYVASMFLTLDDPSIWMVKLLWTTQEDESSRAALYRTPSWSWASIDGGLSEVNWALELSTIGRPRIIGWYAQLSGPTAPSVPSPRPR